MNLQMFTAGGAALLCLGACGGARDASPSSLPRPDFSNAALFTSDVAPYQTRNYENFDRRAFQDGLANEFAAYGIGRELVLNLYLESPPLVPDEGQHDVYDGLGYYRPANALAPAEIVGSSAGVYSTWYYYTSSLVDAADQRVCSNAIPNRDAFVSWVAIHETAHFLNDEMNIADDVAGYFLDTSPELRRWNTLIGNAREGVSEAIGDLAADIYIMANHPGQRSTVQSRNNEYWRWMKHNDSHNTAPYLSYLQQHPGLAAMRPEHQGHIDAVEATVMAANIVLNLGPEFLLTSMQSQAYVTSLKEGLVEGAPDPEIWTINRADVDGRIQNMITGRYALCGGEPNGAFTRTITTVRDRLNSRTPG